MPIVTAYATLGEEGLAHSLMETKARAIFLDPQLTSTLLSVLQTESISLRVVIYHGEPSKTDLANLHARKDLTIIHYDDLLVLGKLNPVNVVPPEPNDLACIMYTSGSVGRPKGALLTHRNLIAAGLNPHRHPLIVVSGVHNAFGPWCDGKNIRTLGYLPLAHIYGLVFEHAAQFWGATIGYARFRTLMDSSVRNCKGDLREFRPQLLASYDHSIQSLTKVFLHYGN